MLTGADSEASAWFFDALGWEGILTWDARDGEAVSDLLIATLSHHGLPLQLEGVRTPNPLIWRPFGQLHPERFVREFAVSVRRWFPAAWNADAPPLPEAAAFQHMFLGLCTLADWIGSNEHWFPFLGDRDESCIDHARAHAQRAVREIGLDISDQREAVGARIARPDFAELFGITGGAPNAIQRQTALKTPLDAPLVLIESETGSGKTEAALWRFARMFEAELVDGLYFALPTRAAALQIYERVHRFVETNFPREQRPEVVLAVPGYVGQSDASAPGVHGLVGSPVG